jgi:ribosomal protein L24
MIKLKIGNRVLIITGNKKKKTGSIKSFSQNKKKIKITPIENCSKQNTFMSISNLKRIK